MFLLINFKKSLYNMCDNKNKKSYKNLIDKFIFKKIRDILFFLKYFLVIK